jgi:chemotaxis signal transduction protein
MHEATAPRRALLFALGDRHYAIRVSAVGGVAECGPIRRVPGAPSAVVGLAEWRGNVLTVLDLAHLLDRPPGDAQPSLVRLAPPLQQAALLLTAYLSVAEVVADFDAPGAEGSEPDSDEFMTRFEHDGGEVRLIDPVRLFRRLDTRLRGRT